MEPDCSKTMPFILDSWLSFEPLWSRIVYFTENRKSGHFRDEVAYLD